MRALITGITGFVGAHLAEYLSACGDELVGLSQRGEWPDAVPASLRQMPLLAADLSQGVSPELRQQLADWEPEVVYHLAAMSVPADCGVDEPTASAIATNVGGTRHLVGLVASMPRPPRIIYSGSCYVYGSVSRDHHLVREDAPPGPLSGYGLTKLAAEQVLVTAAREQQLEVIIARGFQHTGPRQSPRMMIPDWAHQLMQPGAEPIRAICLDTYIDLSDVRDVVRGYRLLATNGRAGRVYNVGSGLCRRGGDLLDLMRQIANSSKKVVELAPGVQQHPVADITRMEDEIHWRPAITIEQTLTDVLDYWHERSMISP